MTSQPIEVSERQVLYFRARRSHLAGPGAVSPAEAARDILGAQSQALGPSLWALSLRTEGRPRAAQLKVQLLDGPRREMVRTWGQRDTLHIYNAACHWVDIVAAKPHLTRGGRRVDMPSEELVEEARRVLESSVNPITRSDLFDILPRDYIETWAARVGSGEIALRYAAGRLLWRLAQRGHACAAGKSGSEQAYANRKVWFSELPWPDRLPEPAVAARRLARQYLSLHGPATVHDVAHFFGARVGAVRKWIETLALEAPLVKVRCGQRPGLLALEQDLEDLTATPPAAGQRWPTRLLPQWDTLMMGHADKSWLAPDPKDRKAIWRGSAVVAATVVSRGRAVATWSQSQKGGRLQISVEPLLDWRARHLVEVRKRAQVLAAHLDLEMGEVKVSGS